MNCSTFNHTLQKCCIPYFQVLVQTGTIHPPTHTHTRTCAYTCMTQPEQREREREKETADTHTHMYEHTHINTHDWRSDDMSPRHPRATDSNIVLPLLAFATNRGRDKHRATWLPSKPNCVVKCGLHTYMHVRTQAYMHMHACTHTQHSTQALHMHVIWWWVHAIHAYCLITGVVFPAGREREGWGLRKRTTYH